MRLIKLKNCTDFAIVSDIDFKQLRKRSFRKDYFGYPITTIIHKGKRKHKRMHSFIKSGLIDHRNRDKLDNRRSNLRTATHSQNRVNRGLQSNNTSGFKGVWFIKERQMYRASLRFNKNYYHLGSFKTKEEAALAYNKAAKKIHGKFACLNDILTIAKGKG